MAKLERIYTVPLGEAYETTRDRRVPKAVKILRGFAAKHMKADGARVTLSERLNEYLWERSIQKPPRKVKVRIVKDENGVKAYLADEKVDEPKDEKKKEDKKPEPKKDKPEAKKEAPAKPEPAKAAAKPEPAKEAKK